MCAIFILFLYTKRSPVLNWKYVCLRVSRTLELSLSGFSCLITSKSSELVAQRTSLKLRVTDQTAVGPKRTGRVCVLYETWQLYDRQRQAERHLGSRKQGRIDAQLFDRSSQKERVRICRRRCLNKARVRAGDNRRMCEGVELPAQAGAIHTWRPTAMSPAYFAFTWWFPHLSDMALYIAMTNVFSSFYLSCSQSFMKARTRIQRCAECCWRMRSCAGGNECIRSNSSPKISLPLPSPMSYIVESLFLTCTHSHKLKGTESHTHTYVNSSKSFNSQLRCFNYKLKTKFPLK